MAMQEVTGADGSPSGCVDDWHAKAVVAYEALPGPIKGCLTLPEPLTSASPHQLCGHWERVHAVVEDLSQALQQAPLPDLNDPTDNLADMATMHPMLAVTTILTMLTGMCIMVSSMTKRGSRGFYVTYCGDTPSQRI